MVVADSRGTGALNRRRIAALCMILMMGRGSFALRADIRMESGWTRSPAVGYDRMAVYGVVINDTDRAVRIVELLMPGAAHVMLHESVLEDGQMRMRHVDAFNIAPRSQIKLIPMGLHLMVMGLEKSLEVGAHHLIHAKDADGEAHELRFKVQSVDSLKFEMD